MLPIILGALGLPLRLVAGGTAGPSSMVYPIIIMHGIT